MNAQLLATALYNLVGICALWGLFACWRNYRTDKLRQDIFDLRAELFEFAASGGIDFENRSYRRLRMLFNSMIRFAHKITFGRLVTTLALEQRHPIFQSVPGFPDELNGDNLGGAARKELWQLHRRLMKKVIFHILTTSLLAVPGLLFFFVCAVVKRVAERRMSDEVSYCKRRIEMHVRLMEQQATEARELEVQNQRHEPVAACVQ